MKLPKQILSVSLLVVSATLGQKQIITCKTEQNNDRTLSIYANCESIGEYTVTLNFTSLEGYNLNINRDHAIATVYKGRTEIAKLTPMPSASSFSLNYSYRYFTGNALRQKPDTTVPYLLPCSVGKKVRISTVRSIATIIGQKPSEEMISTGFVCHLGDTIFAARSGTVFEVFDGVQEGEKTNELFKKDRNHIYVVQKDGTIAHYSFLAPIQLQVEEGDKVIPGDPIALFNKGSDKYPLLFSVNYLDEKKLFPAESQPGEPETPSYYNYLPLLFYSDEAKKGIPLIPEHTYVVAKPAAIIEKELSKKEKKKLGL